MSSSSGTQPSGKRAFFGRALSSSDGSMTVLDGSADRGSGFSGFRVRVSALRVRLTVGPADCGSGFFSRYLLQFLRPPPTSISSQPVSTNLENIRRALLSAMRDLLATEATDGQHSPASLQKSARAKRTKSSALSSGP